MKRAAFYTLGCKVNQQETEMIRTLFENAGYQTVPFEEQADVYIINTCTVTQMSGKKSRQQISRAHAANENAKIVVVGCYAQQAPELVKALPGVQLVVGTQYRGRIVELVEQSQEPQVAVEDIHTAHAFEWMPTAVQGERTRVQLKVQDGCDRYCSYCIIPYVRGRVRSMRPGDVKNALKEIGRRGTGEVVLTGIHLMSYGKDFGECSLSEIVSEAARTPGIGRIRLGSLDPSFITDAFITALQEIPPEKLCRQFHVSMQSGCDTVLKRMKRRYTTDEYALAVEKLRAAFQDCAITTDIIAGFPGETEQEHAETMAFIERIGFARIHVFPYSVREGTAAARMPMHIDKKVKDERAHALIERGKQMEAAFLKAQVGCVHRVLAEEEINGLYEGYTGNYVRARVQASAAGTLVDVVATGVRGETLITRKIDAHSCIETHI